MRMAAEWRENGDMHAETVALLEDQIATLEGVQTQHQVLIDKIWAEVKAVQEWIDTCRADGARDEWDAGDMIYPRLIKFPYKIQELIEEYA